MSGAKKGLGLEDENKESSWFSGYLTTFNCLLCWVVHAGKTRKIRKKKSLRRKFRRRRLLHRESKANSEEMIWDKSTIWNLKNPLKNLRYNFCTLFTCTLRRIPSSLWRDTLLPQPRARNQVVVLFSDQTNWCTKLYSSFQTHYSTIKSESTIRWTFYGTKLHWKQGSPIVPDLSLIILQMDSSSLPLMSESDNEELLHQWGRGFRTTAATC